MDSGELPTFVASDFATSWNKEDILGHGSFAAVRRCQHCDLGSVVVKCFCSSGSTQNCAQVLEEFLREANILAKLKHKNIVELYGITRWANCLGFVMELVENGNLEDLLLDESVGQIPWSLRLRFMEEITDGLAFLHSKSVVHGDLKPQNILLNSELSIKLADFGAAEVFKTRSTFNGLSQKQSRQFTPYYSAPEFLFNQSTAKTSAMDMYSVGIITYETITRQAAFSGSSAGQDLVICLISNSGLKPEIKLVDDIETLLLEEGETDLDIFNAIKGLMLQCWDKDPEVRPVSAEVNQQLKKKLVECCQAGSVSDIRFLSTERKRRLRFKRQSSAKTRLSEFSQPFIQAQNPVDQWVANSSSFNFIECAGDADKSCSEVMIKRLLRLEMDKLKRHLEEKESTGYLHPDSVVNLQNIKQEIKRNCRNKMQHARTASDALVGLRAEEVFFRCLEDLSEKFKRYPAADTEQLCFEEVREVLRIASAHSSHFCDVICKSELLCALGNDLKNLKPLLESNPDMYGFYLIQSLDIIEKCTDKPQNLIQVKRLDILNSIVWYCKNTFNIKIRGDSSLTFRSISVLCHKVGETNSNLLKLNKDVIKYCIQFLFDCLSNEVNNKAVCVSSLVVIHRLELLATNAENSRLMVKSPDFLNILGDVLVTGPQMYCVHLFRLFRHLTKVGRNRRTLSKDLKIMEGLHKLQSELPMYEYSYVMNE